MHNELGMSLPEIQEAGSWKRLESVKKICKDRIKQKKGTFGEEFGSKKVMATTKLLQRANRLKYN